MFNYNSIKNILFSKGDVKGRSILFGSNVINIGKKNIININFGYYSMFYFSHSFPLKFLELLIC